MNHLNSSLFAKKASLWDKKLIFILCCGLALGTMNAQVVTTFNYTGAIVNFTVPPCTSQITIEAIGAGGGASTCWGGAGGLGASMQGTFSVTPGQVLQIMVGQAGQTSCCAGGGGGTFVVLSPSNTPWLIAGGGGGGGYNDGSYANASTGTAGLNGGGSCCSGTGGTNGGGGGGGTTGGMGGGGGLIGNGGNGGYGSYYCSGNQGLGGNAANGGNGAGCCTDAYGGMAFENGGAAGTGGGANGGYGGGGGAYEWSDYGGGGGGGYSGGGGGGYDYCCSYDPACGGGGGSYNAGSNQVNKAGVQSANGEVIIYSGLSVSASVLTNVPCAGESVGSVTAVANGTTPPYTYNWAPGGATTASVNNLTAGTYTVTASDACGNTASAVVTITQPSTLNVSATGNNIPCYGQSSGIASCSVFGGTSPYTYSWSPVNSSNTLLLGLSAGTYSITVIDNHGCVAGATTTITQPEPVVATTAITNVSCNGGNNGDVSASASGGTSPYQYSWSNGQTNSIAVGLVAGTYTLTIMDNNGCSGSTVATISQPAAVGVSAAVTSSIKCYGGSAGALATYSGGSAPYAYLWSDGSTNAFDAGLSVGSYNVTITDDCGGTASASVTVTQPSAALSDTATILGGIKCYGATDGCGLVSATGGTMPYSYMWNDPNNQTTPTACGLSAGTYNVNVTDANGCSVSSATITITQPAALSVTANSTTVLSECTGSAWVKVSGGTPGYTYSWSNGKVTDSISGLCKGNYCCTITDANGCIKTMCVNVESTTGIANLTGGTEGITVYPNPNSGQFTIESAPLTGQSTVEIYNVLGEKVYSQYSTFDAPLSVNLGNQANGIYLYRVISESGSLLGEGKIVLQK